MSIACVGAIGNWIVSTIQRRSVDRRARVNGERVDKVKRLLSRTEEDSDR